MLSRGLLLSSLLFSACAQAAPVFLNAGFETPGATGALATDWDTFGGNTSYLTTD